MAQQLRVVRKLDVSGAELVGFNRMGLPGKVWHVDAHSGNDGNSGGENSPLLTIQAALNKTDDLVAARNRGYHTILVHSGAYSENLTTPVNASAPFCQLIGMEARGRGSGCYIAAATSSSPILTVNARGWRISGFEFEGATTAAAIELPRDADGTNRADYTWIDHCNFTACQYGVKTTGAAYEVVIEDCGFFLITTSAITTFSTGWANPRNWTIRRNEFRECTNYIKGGASWGWNQSMVYENIMQGTGGTYSAVNGEMIDLRGGSIGCNIVARNVMGITQANYDSATGPCLPGTSDVWVGNYVLEGIMDEAPAGG